MSGEVPERPAKLPPFLSIREAVAWVEFRTHEAVARATSADGLAGLRLSGGPLQGSVNDLREELLHGRVNAIGVLASGECPPIEPVEWTRLAIAPRDERRQHPYVGIQIDLKQLITAFPELRAKRRRGAPPKFDWQWVREAAAKESLPTQNQLAEVLISLYAQTHGGVSIGLSTMKRHLSRWGY